MIPGGRFTLIAIFLIATFVCSYDVYSALHGRTLAWVLAAVMAALALAMMRKIVIQDYSKSWW
ncbi:MAG TPA: hypothetical protein VFL13_02465 [Candidatus Baltobacteraceae bacterium]|nr:hypothetical protein [Candidatus Baltobacteraceae bacterium]